MLTEDLLEELCLQQSSPNSESELQNTCLGKPEEKSNKSLDEYLVDSAVEREQTVCVIEPESVSTGTSSIMNGTSEGCGTTARPDGLDKWRNNGFAEDRHRPWAHLNPWLLQNDIILFELPGGAWYCQPPDRVKRGNEPGIYRITEGLAESDEVIQQWSGQIHPARDTTGRWVMLRIIRDGIDGTKHRDILRFLSSYPFRADSRNHALPTLRELETSELTVAVFPLMSIGGIDLPWFFSLGEVLEFVIQAAEGLAFLHEHLIAHRDICRENMVVNLAGLKQPSGTMIRTPWRSSFPIRYFYIDFEYAVQFEAGSQASTRSVVGPPCIGFERDSAPEVYGTSPYDAFSADIFALGLIFWRLFQQIEDQGFLTVMNDMLLSEPKERPTAAEVLLKFHAYRESLDAHALYGSVPRQVWMDWKTTHPNAIQPELE